MSTSKECLQNPQVNETTQLLIDLQGQVLNHKEKFNQISRPLTEQEFITEFAGEVFKQKDLNNCRIVATLDSFVSSGDFKNLIMKNVKKGNDKGKIFYEINLPMNSSNAKTYKIFPDNQEYQIDGQSKTIVEGKSGIVALTKALSQATNARESGGFPGDVMKMLLPSEYHVYEGTKGDQYKLRTFLERFDPNSDLLVLNMGFFGKDDPKRYGKFSEVTSSSVTHSFSVEKIMRQEGRLKVVISNPYDSSKNFCADIDDIMDVKPDFTLATKQNYNFKNSVYHAISSEKPLSSIQNVLRETDKELKNVDIHELGKTPLSYELSSYGIDTQITLQGTNIVFTLNGKTLTIPKRNLSKIYQGKINENYPFYLYAMQIANCLNRMKKNFIDTKKGKDNPFSYYSLTGLLFSSKDNLLPTRVLLDWSQLGISNSEDKEKFVTFLNGLK